MKWMSVCVCVAAIAASKVVGVVFPNEVSRCVGVTSRLLYGKQYEWLAILDYLCVFVCGMIGSWKIVANPLFVVSIAKGGHDGLFIATLCCLLKVTSPTMAFLLVAFVRQVIVEPDPSVSCFWLLIVHFYTDFRVSARVTVVIFELACLFFARHFEHCVEISALLYSIFEPVSDGTSMSFVLSFILTWVNESPIVNAGILLVISGFVFNQAAFYAWWTLKTGNANFTMIGSLAYSLGLLILIYDRCTKGQKQKED